MLEGKNMKSIHPSEMIASAIKRIYQSGLTTTSGGNISIMDENGDMWITPTAIDKGTLQPSDINCIKSDGKIVGPHKPSSEFPFHTGIYKTRPDIKAIIHAHPPALVSFSIVRQVPDTRVLAHARRICGAIGYAAYELPGSEALSEKIAATFRKGFNAVIMENHGTVVGGTNLNDAFHRFETLEFCARTILYGKMLGDVGYLTDEQIRAYESQLPETLPEMDTVSHSSDETGKRTALCDIMHRACRQGLMISSYGTASVRWKENDFLITPADKTKWKIETDDIVQIKQGRREPGKTPSHATWLHQKIYRENPGIHSIIQTRTPFLMAFGVTHTKMNVRTIPESWIFLQDLPTLSFDANFTQTTNIPELLSGGNPALIISNDSVIVTGDKLLQTFDRLEVAEFSAKSIVLSTPLGKMTPISDDQVEDLRKAFLK